MPGERNRIDDLRAAYDADAAARADRVPEPWRLEVMEAWAGELQERGLSSILELGCGTGQLAAFMMGLGFDVTAVDLSPNNVAQAAGRGVPAEVGDFADLAYPPESFDAAFAFNSLLHVPPPELAGVVGGIRRVLRPGGLLLVVVWGGVENAGPWGGDWLDPPRYFSFYTDEQAAAMSFAGFRRLRFDTVRGPTSKLDLHPQVSVFAAVDRPREAP